MLDPITNMCDLYKKMNSKFLAQGKKMCLALKAKQTQFLKVKVKHDKISQDTQGPLDDLIAAKNAASGNGFSSSLQSRLDDLTKKLTESSKVYSAERVSVSLLLLFVVVISQLPICHS